MASLDRLLGQLTEADSAHYAETGKHPLQLTPRQQVQYDGFCEVQTIAVDRTRAGRVYRALCWDGTREREAWHLRPITSRADATFCGIVDHGYPEQ